MLKKFLLNSLSSFVGAWLALILFGVAAFLTVVALVGSFGSSPAPSLKSDSVLKIDLTGTIEETEVPRGLDYVGALRGNIERPQTLRALVTAISDAAANKKVKAIYLDCQGVSAAPATLNALRDALVDFKKSGKKIYAYGDSYSQGDYLVASVADSLFINPDGVLDLRGVGGTSLFLKDFFDKIGVQFEVVKVGTFKSAVEPYISNEMSAPARAQLDTLYDVTWRYIVDRIASARSVKSSDINALMASGPVILKEASTLLKARLFDRCVYRRQMDGIIGRLVDKDPGKVNYISPALLDGASDYGQDYNSGNRIAVLYATGEIAEGNPQGIDCADLVPVIVKLADDDDVKGLVLRVNSPGGSVFGSEQIGEALDYFKSKKKPLAVAMGDYAASGGYWISCHADRIFADPLTITGSIGIFGLIPNVSGLASKLGVSPQTVVTSSDADFPSIFHPMSEAQRGYMQANVERGYDKFVKRVATGRHMTEARVRQIAEGRVWNAMTAQKIGLVDQLGSLGDAIEWVAGKAGIAEKYNLGIYPQLEPDFMSILSAQLENAESSALFAKIAEVTPDRIFARMVYNILTRRHELMLMPPVDMKF